MRFAFLMAENTLDRLIWCIHDLSLQLLLSCIRPVQLFNVEKKFGFVEEQYASVILDDTDDPRLPAPVVPPLTLRQMMDNPEDLLPKQEKRHREAKKLRGSELTRLFQRNCKEMIEMARSNKEAINDKPAGTPSPPLKFEYAHAEVPANIPTRIRQRLFDLEFISVNVGGLVPVVDKQRSYVRTVIQYWFSTSPEAWEYGKKHIHEMRSMREYEYNRTSLAALYAVAALEYVKIVRFFKSKGGASLLTPALARALNLDGDRTFEQIEAEFEIKGGTKYSPRSFGPVDEMISQIDGMFEGEIPRISVGKIDWWSYLVPPVTPSSPPKKT